MAAGGAGAGGYQGPYGDDETTYATAEREAFEEAGVLGHISEAVFGTSTYSKDSSSKLYRVTVHPMEVLSLEAIYREHTERQRQWFPPAGAMILATHSGLQELLRGLNDSANVN